MLYSMFHQAATRNPDRVAIWQDSRSISYGALDTQIQAVSAGLASLGVRAGTFVGTSFDSRIETLVIYYAIARLGAVLVSLDTNSTRAELRQVIEQCRPSLVLCDPRYLENIQAAVEGSGEEVAVISEMSSLLQFEPERNAEAEPFAGDYHLTFTSGSTGRPKGIVLTQRALCRRITDWMATAGLSAEDRHLCILTLSHAVGPQYGAFPALSTGGTLYLMDPLQTTPLRALRTIAEHRINCFLGLPYFYQLMAVVPKTVAFDLSSLRIAMAVAAPLPLETTRAFFSRFGVALNNGYGLSETGIIIFNREREAALAGPVIGVPNRGVDIRLLDLWGGTREDPEEGEIAVRSETIADRYFLATDGPMVRGGWLHTGDVARRGPDGRYTIVGRLSQFINVAGSKVAPVEIEIVIGEVEGVREVAVVGIPDPRTTQKVAAFVVGDADLTAERIQAHCREKLSGFKVPSFVELRAELPKSSLGKILKSQLRLGTGTS